MVLHRQHRRVGADLGRRRARHSSICRSSCRPATTTAAIVPGNGLFGESLVAVDLKTGKRKWHYQLVHHGIWDMDIPCAPILADITVNGRAIKAVAQPTKQALLYVFDRVTGQPIWPIEERPVPKGDVPGEWYSPTQPFPTKPPAYDRQGVSIDDLIDFTPELRAEAVKIVARYKIGPLFTPPVVSKVDGPLAHAHAAVGAGGTNWPGGSYDPETHIALRLLADGAERRSAWCRRRPAMSDMSYIQGSALDRRAARRGGSGRRPAAAGAGEPAPRRRRAARGRGGEGGGGLTVQGLPLIKPPYGAHHARSISNKGEIVWQIAHGETPDNIKNHPGAQGPDDSAHRPAGHASARWSPRRW